MADPLSIAASVVAVTTATLHTVRHVKEFIENIEKCPKEVLALIQELNVFHGSLHSLENILAGLGPDFEADEADDLDRVQPLQTLRSILQQCQETCETIESTLQPFVVKAKGTKQSKWKHSFKWATSEKSLMKIKGDILSYKVSIDTAASLASLLSTKLSAIQLQQQIGRLDRRLREDLESMDQGSFAGSSAVTSDPGLIMRRFLRDRESVLDPVNEQAVILTEADAASLSANNVGELELNLMEDIQSPVSYAIPRSAEAQRAEEGNRAKSKQSYAEIQISYGTSDCSIQNIIFRGENMTNAVISWVFNSRCSCFDQDGRILLSIPVTVPDVPKLTQERRSDLPMSTSWRNGDVVWVKQEWYHLRDRPVSKSCFFTFRSESEGSSMELTQTLTQIVGDSPREDPATHVIQTKKSLEDPTLQMLGAISFDPRTLQAIFNPWRSTKERDNVWWKISYAKVGHRLHIAEA